MSLTRRLLVLISLNILLTIVASGAERFVSVYGNFEIDLPPTPQISRGVRNSEAPDKGVGAITAWDIDNVVFTILYLDPITDEPVDPVAALEESNRNVRETAKRYGGSIQIENDYRFESFPARQFVGQIGAGKMITRNIQAGQRSYSLQAIVRDPKSSSRAFEVMNSFRLIDGRAEIAKRFTALKPVEFARAKPIRDAFSDVKFMGLRGTVRSLTEENEDLTGEARTQGRILAQEVYFDERGFMTLENVCDSGGFPLRSATYGFRRGQQRTLINTRSGDGRTSTELIIRTKLSRTGELLETSLVKPDGKIQLRTTYTEKDDVTEIQRFQDGTKLTVTVVLRRGENGHPVETKFGETTLTYRYEAFDKFGNWTKRTTFERVTTDGKTEDVPRSVSYRTLTYF